MGGNYKTCSKCKVKRNLDLAINCPVCQHAVMKKKEKVRDAGVVPPGQCRQCRKAIALTRKICYKCKGDNARDKMKERADALKSL